MLEYVLPAPPTPPQFLLTREEEDAIAAYRLQQELAADPPQLPVQGHPLLPAAELLLPPPGCVPYENISAVLQNQKQLVALHTHLCYKYGVSSAKLGQKLLMDDEFRATVEDYLRNKRLIEILGSFEAKFQHFGQTELYRLPAPIPTTDLVNYLEQHVMPQWYKELRCPHWPAVYTSIGKIPMELLVVEVTVTSPVVGLMV